MTKLKIISSFIFCVIFIIGCKNNISEAPELNQNLLKSDSNYRVLENSDGWYTLILLDGAGETMINRTYPKEPFITKISDNKYELGVSIGVNSRYSSVIDIEKHQESETIFNVIYLNADKWVYFDDGKLIVSDIFDKNKFYKEIERDYMQTAVPSSAIIKAYIDNDNLYIEYYSQNSIQQSEIIALE
jgi:hypothetical protein